jgi:hypothetical protein
MDNFSTLRQEVIKKLSEKTEDDNFSYISELENIMREYEDRKELLNKIRNIDGTCGFDIAFLQEMLTIINSAINTNIKQKCEYIFKSGKNKGKKCNKVNCQIKTHNMEQGGKKKDDKCDTKSEDESIELDD